MSESFVLPSPIQELSSAVFQAKKVRVFVKRDDLIHPIISGNKWRKLKYNLQAAKAQNFKTLLTFGGAFSNHIAATAVAGQVFDFQTIGIIRGEEYLPLNPTLQLAKESGMQLIYVSRSDYRTKDRLSLAKRLVTESFYFIPEGGTNQLALKGCSEILTEMDSQQFGYICVSCGTGGTVSGIIQAANPTQKVMGFSALKGDFLKQEITNLLDQNYDNWTLQTDYHFGGYAKFKPELIAFINQFKAEHSIQLDPIYTGKLFYGVFDLIEQHHFSENSRILIVHTGGLQGIRGFNERFGNIIDVFETKFVDNE
ncbi:MAG: pyridoxal-phosphate dependent enzyme [Bacteroidota bacterium]